jgi:hypothetical protein
MSTGARTRRQRRIAASAELGEFVGQLRAHQDACDRNWMTRHDSREDCALWLVTPVSHGNRSEDARDDSNYEVAKRLLDEASGFAERCTWPDWTAADGTVYPGAAYWRGGTATRDDAWPGGVICTLLVRADDAAALRVLQRIVSALADYPVLDDAHFYELEWDRAHPDGDAGACYSEDEECPCASRNHAHTGSEFRTADADEDNEIYCMRCGEYVTPGSVAGNGNTHGEDD